MVIHVVVVQEWRVGRGRRRGVLLLREGRVHLIIGRLGHIAAALELMGRHAEGCSNQIEGQRPKVVSSRRLVIVYDGTTRLRRGRDQPRAELWAPIAAAA